MQLSSTYLSVILLFPLLNLPLLPPCLPSLPSSSSHPPPRGRCVSDGNSAPQPRQQQRPQPPPLTRRQPCCWCDTLSFQQQVFSIKPLLSLRVKINPANSAFFGYLCSSARRGNRVEVFGVNFRPLRSSGVWCFWGRGEREVHRRNCLSKHESKFDVVLLMLYYWAFGLFTHFWTMLSVACIILIQGI